MENVKLHVKGEKLVIEIDLSVQGTPSRTGKSVVIASSRGNASVPGRAEKIGINVYRPL